MYAGRALVIRSRFFWEAVFGDYLLKLIVGRANCNKAGGTRAFSQGRLEPFGNLAVY